MVCTTTFYAMPQMFGDPHISKTTIRLHAKLSHSGGFKRSASDFTEQGPLTRPDVRRATMGALRAIYGLRGLQARLRALRAPPWATDATTGPPDRNRPWLLRAPMGNHGYLLRACCEHLRASTATSLRGLCWGPGVDSNIETHGLLVWIPNLESDYTHYIPYIKQGPTNKRTKEQGRATTNTNTPANTPAHTSTTTILVLIPYYIIPHREHVARIGASFQSKQGSGHSEDDDFGNRL